jgi:hypothetical protein
MAFNRQKINAENKAYFQGQPLPEFATKNNILYFWMPLKTHQK